MNLPTFPTTKLDKDAVRIVQKLQQSGYRAYLVGGCVRDSLLHITPKDFDVATNATPEQIRSLFRNARIIGRRFRLVHIFFGKKEIQTATFRKKPIEESPSTQQNDDFSLSEIDAEQNSLLIVSDNTFGTEEQDAHRRDFTINGLFYDPIHEKLVDHVGGLLDLSNKQIRTIGDANIRFQEDPVRMLRAIRFAAKLGFDIEDNTYSALVQNAKGLLLSAKSRLLEELFRLLRCGQMGDAICLLQESQLLTYFLPAWSTFYDKKAMEFDPFFRALDQLVQSGTEVYNSTLIAALCGPALSFFFEANKEHKQPAWHKELQMILEPLYDLPFYRRDTICLRHILLTQKSTRQRALFKNRKRKGKNKDTSLYFKENEQFLDFYFAAQKLKNISN